MRPYLDDPFCLEVFDSFEKYYPKVGFFRPWIGYFFLDGENIVATGGFKGQPKNRKIEIAYGTVPLYEGRSYATEVCHKLVHLALDTDPSLLITARTLKEENASTRVLKKNNFKLMGTVEDPEDGEVWEWHYQG